MAQSKSITVSHQIDPDVDEVFGEAVLIEETLTNVLFNAVSLSSWRPERNDRRVQRHHIDQGTLRPLPAVSTFEGSRWRSYSTALQRSDAEPGPTGLLLGRRTEDREYLHLGSAELQEEAPGPI